MVEAEAVEAVAEAVEAVVEAVEAAEEVAEAVAKEAVAEVVVEEDKPKSTQINFVKPFHCRF